MSQNISRLKELLFDRETATLEELQERLESIANADKLGRDELSRLIQTRADDLTRTIQTSAAAEAALRSEVAQKVDGLLARAGTEERFRTSVADVLDGALRDAETKRHDQMSRAVAPLVVKTIRAELRNSQDEMVEALYPITGRLVKAYIASAMRDLTAQINRRLAGGSNPLMLRLRSLLTGRPVAELALAETQRLEVAELFLIRRGSGELVQHWPDGPQAINVPSNSNIHLSGVLTAINDFAAQALKDDGGNLRSFTLDDFQMYLRASPAYLLAAKCRGVAPPGVESVLDEELLRLIEHNRQALSGKDAATVSNLLAPLARRLETRLDDRQRELAVEAGLGFNPINAVALLLGLPLLMLAGWAIYENYEVSTARRAALRAIAATPQVDGYPARIEVAQRGREVTVTALVPNAKAKSEVLERLRGALPGSAVIDRIAVLPNQAAELEPQVIGVRRDLAGLEGDVLRSAVRRAVARAGRGLEQSLPELKRLQEALLDGQSRSIVQATAGSIERQLTGLKTVQASLSAATMDGAQLSALAAPMHGIAEQIKAASSRLNSLLAPSAGVAVASHGNAAPSDIAESAEELGASAEQFATIAVAVLQSASVKSPPPVPPPGPTARERLEKWVRANAIFFADGTDYRNPSSAQAAIDAAARLIRESNAFVRVVGFTDERGGQTRNIPLAQSRAQRVVDALIERGVPRQSLVALGRPIGIDISSVVGPQSPNRRVEFELGFEGEASDQP